jgi:integrase
MSAARLTRAEVDNARPRAKAYRLADGASLYLLVSPDGGRYWEWRFRWGGKQQTHRIGVYSPGAARHVGIKEARDAAGAAARSVRAGLNPNEHRREQRARQRVIESESFEGVARAWHRMKAPRWSDQHADDVLLSLEKDVFPKLGAKHVRNVTTLAVVDCVRAIADRGAVDIAHRVKQRIAGALGYAVQLRLIEQNPAAGLRDVLPAVVKGQRPSLPPSRLPELFAKLATYQGDPSTLAALRLAMLTAVRPGEVRFARWSEFDLDAALWTIPGQRMKGTKARKARADHLVPLSRQAVELLRELHRMHGHYAILFPGLKSEDKPISENTLTGALKRMGFAGVATAHGFRSLFSTVANEHGFDADHIERQLAHVPDNEIRAAYNRAKWIEPRRAMLQWFADYLDAIAVGRHAPLAPHQARAAAGNDPELIRVHATPLRAA